MSFGSKKLTQIDRLNYFIEKTINDFTRKDYMKVFKDISSATASRDLNKGIDLKIFIKNGKKNKTKYRLI